ncbi:MAG: HutD family protein [Gammaproteobacteria bacterium]
MRALANGICLFTSADYRRMPWKNGRGWTTEIAVSPAGAGQNEQSFDWRVSLAEIKTDCEFSAFPGYDRTILLAEGAGMELSFDAAPPQRIEQRYEPFRFKGEWHSRCWLLDGPVRDFNVMTLQARWRHSCEIAHGTPALLPVIPGLQAVIAYCFQGSTELKVSKKLHAELKSQETLLYSRGGMGHHLQIVPTSADTVVAAVGVYLNRD